MKGIEHKRVLVIDDEPAIRDILKELLQEMGVETVIEAADGFQALRAIDSDPHHLDLVVCDWNMPGMSGHSVYRQIRTSHPKMPFIMVTARNDLESVEQARLSGIISYVAKPVTYEELERKVVHAFRSYVPGVSALQGQDMLDNTLA